jgi:aryl-alcohol dehydrogenase-like predicted oxidoreductase
MGTAEDRVGEIARMGLGLAALGRPGYINLGHAEDLSGGRDVQSMRRHAHSVLDEAFGFGIRYFDAARSYGRAEEFLASWITDRGIGRGQVTVASKWGYTYTAGWRVDAEVHEVKDHTLPTLQRQLRESRGLLGEHLDLYQIHSATLDSGVLEDEAVLDELARLRDGGLRIGLSLSGPAQAATLDRAMRIRRSGDPLFGAVQATWNPLEPSAGEALERAHGSGMRVIVKEALANGQLTSRGAGGPLADRLTSLLRDAPRLNLPVDALALAAALARPWADVVLSGAARRDHLRSNLLATSVSWSDVLETLIAPLRMDPREYWRLRGQLTWN